MKIVKKATAYFFLFLVLFFIGLFLWQPYLLRVLWYRTPDATTYKAFPQDTVQKVMLLFILFGHKKRELI